MSLDYRQFKIDIFKRMLANNKGHNPKGWCKYPHMRERKNCYRCLILHTLERLGYQGEKDETNL